MRSSFKKRKIAYSLVVLIILMMVAYLALPNKELSKGQPTNQPASNSKPTVAQTEQFDKSVYPTDQADSLWAIVNKGRALPSTYAPAGLRVPAVPLRYNASDPSMLVRSDTATALEKLFAAAKQASLPLKLTSGYRSYSYQTSVYSGYVRSVGTQKADTFSARAGHSEHQTGLAADLEPLNGQCELDQCFGDLAEGKWLDQNAYKYGFIIRYQKDTQSLTGYEYEPWHVRYIGTDLAIQIHQTGQTLEQFFSLPIYDNYPDQSMVLKV